MKKAVNVTTAIALALAASVTYNVVQHQRAKGIRPESSNKEEGSSPETSAASAATAAKSVKKEVTSITYRSASYDRYNDDVDIYFTTPTSLQTSLSKDDFEIEPKVAISSVYSSGSRITIDGNFKNGVKYRIRVKKGLKDLSGKATLENDAVFDLVIPELRESFSFLTSGSVFPIRADKIEFPYSVRNIKSFNVKLYRSFDNNMTIPDMRDTPYYMDLIGERRSR